MHSNIRLLPGSVFWKVVNLLKSGDPWREMDHWVIPCSLIAHSHFPSGPCRCKVTNSHYAFTLMLSWDSLNHKPKYILLPFFFLLAKYFVTAMPNITNTRRTGKNHAKTWRGNWKLIGVLMKAESRAGGRHKVKRDIWSWGHEETLVEMIQKTWERW